MSIDGVGATRILDRDFSVFDTAHHGGSGDGKISEGDLKAVAENKDGKFSAQDQEAAQFLLDSQAARSALDVGAGRKNVDGTISREDVDGTLQDMADGRFEQRLLDTAAGKGKQDGYVSTHDIDAALTDPGVPKSLKDALLLLRQGTSNDAKSSGEKALSDLLGELSKQDFSRLAALERSAGYQQLSDADASLVAKALRESHGDDALPASIRALLDNPQFHGLSDDEKTAVLSQVANYPDPRSVANIERLLAKDWFMDFDLSDKQRTLKAIAFMSQNDAGDPEINANTLDRVLAPDSDYVFAWDPSLLGDINGGQPDPTDPRITVSEYGNADGKTITFNSNMVNAGNDPLIETYNSRHVVLHTIAHEVNHNVNADAPDTSFAYLQQEYRAWYVGFQAEFGRPPTNADAMERWRNEITGAYSAYAQAAIDSSRGEALKFAQELSLMTGNPVPEGATQDELKAFIEDQVDLNPRDYADPDGAAPIPPGNKTNL